MIKKLLTFIGILFLLYWLLCILVDAVVIWQAGVLWTVFSCGLGGAGALCFFSAIYPPFRKWGIILGFVALIGYILFHHFVPPIRYAHQLTDCLESGDRWDESSQTCQ